MPTITELTQGFKPVETNYAADLNPFYNAFFKTRKYPRFYQSLLEMAQYTNIPLYYWGILQRTLIVVVRRYIHRPVLYLILPPINLDLNHNIEFEIMQMFREVGCHTRLSEEDMQLFNLSESDVVKDHNNNEFIYLAGDSKNMPGKKWRNIRYKINQFAAMENEGEVKVEYSEEMTPQLYRQCKAVYEIWIKSKEKKSIHSAHKSFPGSPKSLQKLLVLIYNKKGDLSAWGASEAIGNQKIVQTTRFRNYNDDFFVDPTMIIHHRECAYWAEKMGDETLCNFGTGLFPGLIEHKQRLKPIKTLQLYNLKTERQIEKSDWDNACQGDIKSEKGLLF